MLNIGRIAPAGERYYLSAVATGVEDYYVAEGEAPGRRLGRALELDGPVTAEHLQRVLGGNDPSTGEQLAAHPARQVPGFDLTFRAPKSVSIAWGLTDRRLASEFVAAHDAAVDAAISYLEDAAAWTRRGAGGAERVQGTGLIGAAFRHRTSRADDPLLHTHVLVANLVQTADDGVWRTLDSRRIFAHAKTAGFVYQAHLRFELTRRLGIAWGEVRNGYADIANLPRAWIEAFSRRRQAIEAAMGERGETSPRAAQVAALATRPVKNRGVSEAELRLQWRTRADELGIGRDWSTAMLDRQQWARPDIDRLYRELVGDEALTRSASAFTRRDVIRAVAERLPAGAPAGDLVQIADAIITQDPDEILELGATRGRLTAMTSIRRDDGHIVPADPEEWLFTTRGLLIVEQTAADHAIRRGGEGTAIVDSATVTAALSRRATMTDEQATMVRRLTTSGAGVEVVVGKAGTGKTFALDAARDAWTAAGMRVTGAALAARAAAELSESTGMEATTLARLLHQLDDVRRHHEPLLPGQVLVVDEAGMVGTRQLARLLEHTERLGVKTVLVGDPHQLPEIDAGGLFATLATRLDVVELSDNRRQDAAWEVAALDELRHGSATAAISAYDDHGRLVTAETAEAIRDQLVTDWWETFDARSADRAVMIALRRADVADLNARARGRLLRAGLLTGPALTLENGTELQAGDRIVCLRNSRRLGVVNGSRATVTALDVERHVVEVVDDKGARRRLPGGYLHAGHVVHGYAITGHKAQGLTVDHTFVLGSDSLYREWGYVALSRGRQTNRLYLHADTAAHRCELGELDLHGHAPNTDPVGRVAGRLAASRAQLPVSDTLGARWRRLETFLSAREVRSRPHTSAELDRMRVEREHVTRRIAELERQRDRWVAPALRSRTRDDRRRIVAELDRQIGRLERLDAKIGELTDRLSHLPDAETIAAARDEHATLDRQLREQVDSRLAAVEAAPPDYLLATIGAPLTGGHGRDRWLLTARLVEDHRARFGITHPTLPLGDRPDATDDLHRGAHDRAVAELDRSDTRTNGPARGPVARSDRQPPGGYPQARPPEPGQSQRVGATVSDPHTGGPMRTDPDTTVAQQQMISPSELAEFLNVPVSTIYQWRYRGEGPPGFKLGNHVRYRWADIHRWLDHHADQRR